MPGVWRLSVAERKRTGKESRKTRETTIEVVIGLEGGAVTVKTGVAFLDHMLTLFAAHGGFALSIKAKGDTDVDDHHLVEDAGICLGKALAKALGDKKGISRYGDALVPMDEALAQVVLDISGRAHLSYGLEPANRKIKEFDVQLVEEFFLGFVRNVPCTLHIRQLAGRNGHHVIEAAFKAFGRAAGRAVMRGGPFGGTPSTKGVL